MFLDNCFVETRKRLEDGTIKRTLTALAFPTRSGKNALTAEQKKSEEGKEARKKENFEALEERQRVRAAKVQEEAAKVQEKAQQAETEATKVTILQLFEKIREARELAKKLDPDSAAKTLKEAHAAFLDNPESIAHLLNSVDFTKPDANLDKVSHFILVYFYLSGV